MSKKKPVKYERLEQWVQEHDARIVQAGSYPAQVVFVKEDDLKSLCKAMDLPRMGKLSGGRCYQLAGEDFFAVIMAFKLTSGQLISAIAHECYHATNFIYKRYNVRHSLSNDEPGAYLISHMAYYAAKFIEEQGYALSYTGPVNTDATDSRDLRAELPSPQQGRVDAGAEPTGRAGGDVPREEPGEAPAPILSCGCAGRCIGHPVAPEPCVSTDPVAVIHCDRCGEELEQATAYKHVCAMPLEAEAPALRLVQCQRCGVEHPVHRKHCCNKRDVMAWEAKHEQDY
ncbi:hypothetical protein [Pseudomonas phage PSA28]|nr:hypothetical protein [Pseudomonas phage PSA28]